MPASAPSNDNGRLHDDDDEAVASADFPRLLARTVRHVEQVDRRTEAMAVDLAGYEAVQAEHSRLLGDISAAVVRIEGRLSGAEQTAKRAARNAARASGSNEIVTEFAKVALEGQRDELAARRERRKATYSAVARALAWLTAGGGIVFLANRVLGCE